MPFVIMIIGLLGGLQIYFFNTADRAQKSIAAQILLSRSQVNINEEIWLEQLLSVQVQELMRRNGISALELEKGLSADLNKNDPGNSAADQKSAIFTPGTNAKNAANELLNFKKLEIGSHAYMVKAVRSSLPKDPTGYVDLAVCPVDGNSEDRRTARKLRLRLSVKSGFLNAVTGNNLSTTLPSADIYGNVAEFGYRDQMTQYGYNWRSARIYGTWFSQYDINQDRTSINNGFPYEHDFGLEWLWPESNPWVSNPNLPRREFVVLTGNAVTNEPRMAPSAFDLNKVNRKRILPDGDWRNFAYVQGAESKYDGPELAWNPQTRSRSLPKFNPDMVRLLARGSLTVQAAGDMNFVPYGKDWTARQQILKIEPDKDSGLSVLDGNLMLDGRIRPFNICGRIFVTGDVVVMGRYKSKGTDGSTCQSSIIAGRNMYVADDVMAEDRVPDFDLTVQANANQLAKISDPVEARKFAEKNWTRDQLVLLSTNSTVVGNPFPFGAAEKMIQGRKFLEPSIAGDLTNLIQNSYRKYGAELYYDRSTGVMAVPNSIQNGTKTTVCYTLPWENIETTCRVLNAKGEHASNERFIKLLMNEYPWLGTVPDVLTKFHVDNGFYVPEAYWKVFLPLNVVDRTTGELKAWITEKQYRAAVANTLTETTFKKPDACGRRNQLISSFMPLRDTGVMNWIPGSKYWVQGVSHKITADSVMKEVDALTGFLETYGDYPVDYKEVDWEPQSSQQYTVRELMKQQLEMCHIGRGNLYTGRDNSSATAYRVPFKKTPVLANKQADGVYKPDDLKCMPDLTSLSWNTEPGRYINPDTKVIGSNWALDRVYSETDLDRRRLDFGTPDIKIQSNVGNGMSYGCYINFYVSQKTDQCSGEKPTSFTMNANIHQWENWTWVADRNNWGTCAEMPDSAGNNGFACLRTLRRTEHVQCVGCMASGKLDKTKCVPTGKYFYHWTSASPGMPVSEYRKAGADFSLGFSSGHYWYPYFSVNSRFLDGTLADGTKRSEVLQNRVRQIDAFLFSNQFLSVLSDTGFDRTLQINGGISSRDFIGSFASAVGPYRPGENATDPTAAFRGLRGGVRETGMIVVWDPRYRYTEDIIQADVGSTEMTDNASDVQVVCDTLKGATQ